MSAKLSTCPILPSPSPFLLAHFTRPFRGCGETSWFWEAFKVYSVYIQLSHSSLWLLTLAMCPTTCYCCGLPLTASYKQQVLGTALQIPSSEVSKASIFYFWLPLGQVLHVSGLWSSSACHSSVLRPMLLKFTALYVIPKFPGWFRIYRTLEFFQ
jgi:hypothetical protein